MIRRMFPRRDDRGSLPMVMLVLTVSLTMSAAMTPIVIRQVTATRAAQTRDTSLNAAQAGMDVMMARVRAASDGQGGDTDGLLENLPPCTLKGDAGVTGVETLPYYVTISYKDSDGNTMADCPPTSVPTTAVVTSVGYGTRVGPCGADTSVQASPPPNFQCRQLTATYVFTTNNSNIPGGQIRIASSTVGNLCIDAGSAKIVAGTTAVTMQKCNGGSSQRFGYNSDLYIKLIYSETNVAPYGMCLGSGSSHSDGNPVKFYACPAPTSGSDTPTGIYQWSLDGASRFHSTNSSQSIEGTCMAVVTPSKVGSAVQIKTCGSGADQFIWRSDPGVGAGMAGDRTNQLVNYEQFSRCLDVTNQSTSSTYMIAWFCKQAPTGAVDWNQIWYHPIPKAPATNATGNIIVKKGGAEYCLQSPLSTAATVYVTVDTCSSAAQKAAADLQWTVYHDTGVYATSYRIMDSKNFCLAPTPQDAAVPDTHSDGTSKIKVEPCDDSELQKWNAPANLKKPTPLTNLTEK